MRSAVCAAEVQTALAAIGRRALAHDFWSEGALVTTIDHTQIVAGGAGRDV